MRESDPEIMLGLFVLVVAFLIVFLIGAVLGALIL